MRQAAKRAGIFPLIMIKEPEAASLSALISLKDKLAVSENNMPPSSID